MLSKKHPTLKFESQTITAKYVDPSGKIIEQPIEIRRNPITGRTCRLAFSRSNEKEPATDSLPQPPPDANETTKCPFCRPQVSAETPAIHPALARNGRMSQGDSLLFPNLYPYGSYSAVSLFNDEHFVEIGKASRPSYANSLINCCRYLASVLAYDPQAIYTAITQNHLPSAGGSLVHPHLQINADSVPANHHRNLRQRADKYYQQHGDYLFSSYLSMEKDKGLRYIGETGSWQWLSAFAPEGFYEIWGILPRTTSFLQPDASDWEGLAQGILYTQRYYRSLCRNGYNFGLLSVESPNSRLELRIVIMVRSNYAPWVRSDHTGFEVMLGDMTTFDAPEQTAKGARSFFMVK